MTSATWGELIAEAEFDIRRARKALVEPFRSVAAARDAALGHNDVLRGLNANLRILDPASNPPYARIVEDDLTQLGELIAAVTPMSARDLPDTSDPWHSAARKLHAAADTLGSHLGADRTYRTPDAAVLDDPTELRLAITTVAALSETTADAACHLALRVHETALHHDATVIDAWAQGALKTAAALKNAASDLVAEQAPEPHTGRLLELSGAPLLRPTTAGDPIVAARQSFDLIRLIAHRQSRGELQAGVDTLRILAHVGALASMHSHAILAAASTTQPPHEADRLTRMAESLRDTRACWTGIDAAIAGCASISRSPQLLIREAGTLNTSLASLTLTPDGGWLTPERILGNRHRTAHLMALVNHIASRLPDLSRSATAISCHLERAGVVVAPTRECEDIDYPYRWAPLRAQRRDAIRAATANAVLASNVVFIGIRRPPGMCPIAAHEQHTLTMQNSLRHTSPSVTEHPRRSRGMC